MVVVSAARQTMLADGREEGCSQSHGRSRNLKPNTLRKQQPRRNGHRCARADCCAGTRALQQCLQTWILSRALSAHDGCVIYSIELPDSMVRVNVLMSVLHMMLLNACCSRCWMGCQQV